MQFIRPAVAPLSGDKPIVISETGYENAVNNALAPGVSETASGKYLPRALFEHFNFGAEKSMPYELLDDTLDTDPSGFPEYHYGILRYDHTYKPAATALKNLFTLVANPGPAFAPGKLDYTIAGGNADTHHTLLQKSDGSFWLALWQDVDVYDLQARADVQNAALPVTLHFATPIRAAETYQPNQSADALARYNALTELTVGVPDQLLLLKLVPDYFVGDANFDFNVDKSDLAILLRNYGQPGSLAQGDFNGDGVINFPDYQLLERAFHVGILPPPAPAPSVPEPGSVTALLIAAAIARSGRRRRVVPRPCRS
jgi:hypothetical protein